MTDDDRDEYTVPAYRVTTPQLRSVSPAALERTRRLLEQEARSRRLSAEAVGSDPRRRVMRDAAEARSQRLLESGARRRLRIVDEPEDPNTFALVMLGVAIVLTAIGLLVWLGGAS